MNRSQVDYAERKALEEFDKWNGITNVFDVGTGLYSEIQAVILDAVHIGIQMAMYNKVETDKEGNIKRSVNPNIA
jgi:hypothetical protein